MTLAEVRVNIDRVDRSIRELFQERMGLADQVAQVKAQTGDAIRKPDREAAMISRLSDAVDPAIRKEYIALVKKVIGVSCEYQYGRTLQLRNCFDIDFEKTELIPEALAAVNPDPEVTSLFPGKTIQPADTLAGAAKLIREGKADAGISAPAAEAGSRAEEIDSFLKEEGMFINRRICMQSRQADCDAVMFSDQLNVLPDHNRLRFCFTCSIQRGRLAEILSAIADYQINLTEFRSAQNPKTGENSGFFAEIEANLLEPEVQALVFQIESETEHFRILGSYASR